MTIRIRLTLLRLICQLEAIAEWPVRDIDGKQKFCFSISILHIAIGAKIPGQAVRLRICSYRGYWATIHQRKRVMTAEGPLVCRWCCPSTSKRWIVLERRTCNKNRQGQKIFNRVVIDTRERNVVRNFKCYVVSRNNPLIWSGRASINSKD